MEGGNEGREDVQTTADRWKTQLSMHVLRPDKHSLFGFQDVTQVVTYSQVWKKLIILSRNDLLTLFWYLLR